MTMPSGLVVDDPTHLRWLRQRDQAWFNGDTLARAVIAYLNRESDQTDLRVALCKYADNDGPCLNIPKDKHDNSKDQA